MKNFISQFIPIIVIFLVLSNSRKMAQFSHTILGKIIALSIIVFYTYQNKLLGLLTCVLFIFYIQSDSVENMLNMGDSGFKEAETPMDEDLPTDDNIYLPNQKKTTKSKEAMVNYTETYKEKINPTGFAQNKFRAENCKGNVLKYKEMTVPKDMASHVFPELSFIDEYPCNPCNMSCNFSIIESKIETEEKLVKPTFSADTM
jgi:hypothetical protein